MSAAELFFQFPFEFSICFSQHLGGTALQLRRDSFSTSARQCWHVGAAVLPLRRVPLACRRNSFTISYNILYLPRAQSISAVLYYNFGASFLPRRQGSFSTSARQFCHFGASGLPLRRVHLARRRVFYFGMSAGTHSVSAAQVVLACRRDL